MRRSGDGIYPIQAEGPMTQFCRKFRCKGSLRQTDACDNTMKLNLQSDQCWEVITPVIDELALLGVVTAD